MIIFRFRLSQFNTSFEQRFTPVLESFPFCNFFIFFFFFFKKSSSAKKYTFQHSGKIMRAKQLIPFPRPPKYKATAILFNPGEPPRILPTPLSRLGHVSRDKSSDVQSLLALEELCQIAGRANSSWIRVSTSIARKSLVRFRPCFTELSGVGIFARCSKNKVFVSRDERGRGKWGRKKRRGGIEKRDEIVESGHSLGTRSPFLTFIIIFFFSLRSFAWNNDTQRGCEKKFGFSLSIGKIFSYSFVSNHLFTGSMSSG